MGAWDERQIEDGYDFYIYECMEEIEQEETETEDEEQ